jgi:hypothetical protein
MKITCAWCDRYTARYNIVTDAGVTVNVTGRTDEAKQAAREIAGLRPGERLPEPVPYSPPKPRGIAAYVASRRAGEAMPRTAHDCLPGDSLAKGGA